MKREMKNPTDWHRECQENSERYYLIALENALKDLEKARDGLKDNRFYKYQIKEAEKAGKDSFDRDKFRIKKVKP